MSEKNDEIQSKSIEKNLLFEQSEILKQNNEDEINNDRQFITQDI